MKWVSKMKLKLSNYTDDLTEEVPWKKKIVINGDMIVYYTTDLHIDGVKVTIWPHTGHDSNDIDLAKGFIRHTIDVVTIRKANIHDYIDLYYSLVYNVLAKARYDNILTYNVIDYQQSIYQAIKKELIPEEYAKELLINTL